MIRSKQNKFYDLFRNMHRRCYDPNYHSYHRYGGRGITVCPEWHDYKTFQNHFLESWATGLSIERLNNDLGYTPENAVLIPKSQNTKPRKIDYGELMHLRAQGVSYKELAEYFGVSHSAVSAAAYKVRNAKASF